MRILILGNSFTYYNDMPKMLSAILNEEVVAHTKGGGFLHEHLDPESEMGMKTLKALQEVKWDYVVLQEQSKAPIFAREQFQQSVEKLCQLIRQAGAKPLLYATWAYREDSEKLASTGLSYEEMSAGLYESYHAAQQTNDALIADVGALFDRMRHVTQLQIEDDFHPTPAGSMLAAAAIARVIENDR